MSIATISALRSLQKAHGLTASGTVDPATQELLIEVMIEVS